MNKIQLMSIFFAVIVVTYGITTIYAQNDDISADCIMDGSDNTGNHGYQRGTMDGSQDRMQLKDGSGAGGMYGNGSCT